MTFQILECVQCKAAGCVEILPWRTADGMTALSARCDKCDHMVILDMAKGVIQMPVGKLTIRGSTVFGADEFEVRKAKYTIETGEYSCEIDPRIQDMSSAELAEYMKFISTSEE